MTQPTTTKTHAKFSPSGMAANMACIGKIAMEDGLPNTSSKFADEGTCAHFLGAWCLSTETDADEHIDDSVVLWRNIVRIPINQQYGVFGYEEEITEGECFKSGVPENAIIYHSELITEAFAAHVQTYIDHVRDYAHGHKILVEQKLSIEEITGEEGATGTADAVILLPDEIVVTDLKFGMGNEVSAENNPQLMTYALGAFKEYASEGYYPRQVRLVISQPRISNAPNEWVCSIEDLLAFGRKVKDKAARAFRVLDVWRTQRMLAAAHLNPNEVSCKYCKANRAGICKAIDNKVLDVVGVGFDDLTAESVESHGRMVHDHVELGRKLRAVPLIEIWMAGVRAAAERELQESANNPEVCEKLGFKLVQGKRGNQAWESEAVGEKLVRRMVGAKNAYDKKLKSPTKIKEMLKGDDKKLQVIEKYIRQAEGKPSVAPISDKREALVLQDLSFDNLEADLI